MSREKTNNTVDMDHIDIVSIYIHKINYKIKDTDRIIVLV